VAELDWACRAAAFQAAAAAGLDPSLRLFVNCEPVSLGVPCPDDLWPVVDAAERRLRVVMEVTERAVARDPTGLRSRTRPRSRRCRPGGCPSGPPRTCSCP
jgi:EAL domain-containing protein (putative c-di-GMP-specific phosphodiesterase class I)